MSEPNHVDNAGDAVELPSRLVFSLLTAAVRVAARVGMPLNRLTALLRSAYFLEYRRRHPRDLATVAEKLGVSVRTAGTLNRQLDDEFFRAETSVEPIRLVTGELLGAPADREALATATGLDASEIDRVVRRLLELGWVDEAADGALTLSGRLRVFMTTDLARRLDGVNHQAALVADSVWSRFVRGEEDAAGGRSWFFAARPEDVAEAMQRTFATLRSEAIAMEERALAEGDAERFGITVAFTPLEEDR